MDADGENHFFFAAGEKKFPFVTLVTGDQYDKTSNLSRPGVYRLNIGVAKETYRSHFGPSPGWGPADGSVDTGHDFTVLDRLMPHPIYAPMGWVCVLNASAATFETLKPLIAEGYQTEMAKRRQARASGSP